MNIGRLESLIVRDRRRRTITVRIHKPRKLLAGVALGMCVTSSPEVRKWRHDACPDLPMAAVNASGMNAPANQLAAKYLMSTLHVDWESTLKCIAWIPERSQQTFTICGKPRYAVLVGEKNSYYIVGKKQIQVGYVVHIMTRYCNLLPGWTV